MELTVFVKKQALKTEGGSVWLCTQKQHMEKYNEQLLSNKVYIAEVKQGQGNVRSPSLVFPWVDHTGLGWCFWMDLDGLYSGGWNNISNLFTKREKKEWFERFCKDQRVDASGLISRLVAVWINSLMWCVTWCFIFCHYSLQCLLNPWLRAHGWSSFSCSILLLFHALWAVY